MKPNEYLKYMENVSCEKINIFTHCACVCLVSQSCLTLWNPVDCSLPGSSVHGIFQARILEWVDISSPRGSSWPRDQTWVSCVSCICRWILCHWAIGEACCWDQGGFQWQAAPEGWGRGEVQVYVLGEELNRIWGPMVKKARKETEARG